MKATTTIDNNDNNLLLSKRSEQLDALQLDAYLASLLRIESLTLYFPKPLQACFPVLRECLVPIITVLQSLGHTPARRILGLEITTTPSSSPVQNNHRRQFISKLLLYSFISFLLPELYRMATTQFLLQQQQRASTEDDEDYTTATTKSIRRVANERCTRLIQKFFQTCDTVIPMVRLGLLLSCWSSSGGTTTPDLGMIVSGLRYSTTSSSSTNNNNDSATKHQPSSSLQVIYAHRRWLHQEATRLLPMIANPMLNSVKETREMLKDWARFCLRMTRRYVSVEKNVLIPKGCPLCQQDPIGVPYEINCGHVYCYTCLWAFVHRQHNARCRVCQMTIVECRRPIERATKT